MDPYYPFFHCGSLSPFYHLTVLTPNERFQGGMKRRSIFLHSAQMFPILDGVGMISPSIKGRKVDVMKKEVKIGKSDLNVNPIGLGTNAVGGHNLFPDLDEQAGKDLVKTAIENGIDFIDTAYLYGAGRSE